MHWAPLDAGAERMVIIDVGGGPVDRLLHDDDVATVLNDRFQTVFLHPSAAPDWTTKLGWPSMTALAPDCRLRAHGRPTTPSQAVDLANAALRDRKEAEARTWVPRPGVEPPPLPEPWSPTGPILPCKGG